MFNHSRSIKDQRLQDVTNTNRENESLLLAAFSQTTLAAGGMVFGIYNAITSYTGHSDEQLNVLRGLAIDRVTAKFGCTFLTSSYYYRDIQLNCHSALAQAWALNEIRSEFQTINNLDTIPVLSAIGVGVVGVVGGAIIGWHAGRFISNLVNNTYSTPSEDALAIRQRTKARKVAKLKRAIGANPDTDNYIDAWSKIEVHILFLQVAQEFEKRQFPYTVFLEIASYVTKLDLAHTKHLFEIHRALVPARIYAASNVANFFDSNNIARKLINIIKKNTTKDDELEKCVKRQNVYGIVKTG